MDIEALLERLSEAAMRSGFKVSSYGKVGDVSLPVLERHCSPDAPDIYISSGIHGNEPAGPMTVLEMLRKDSLPQSVNLTLFPVINPIGLKMGTRENADGIDLNRDYGPKPSSYETAVHMDYMSAMSFDFAICLHEDDDGQGFYIYSHIPDSTEVDYPGLAIEAARPFTGIDQREEIDEMPALNGRMCPSDSVIESFGDNLPEALYLMNKHHSRYTFTTETPSGQPITKRMCAHEAVICALLKGFLA